jgi:hypothetical protein
MAYIKPVRYRVKNRKKYIGDPDNVWIRSGWEKQFFIQCDLNEDVVAWGSEIVVIPYPDPHKRGNIRRYFVDAIMKNKNGEVFLVEIKPYKETIKPEKKKGKRKKTFLYEAKTYDINQAKWKAAREYCKKRGWKFIILTEKNFSFK